MNINIRNSFQSFTRILMFLILGPDLFITCTILTWLLSMKIGHVVTAYQKVEDADALPQMVVGSSLQLVHMVEPVGFVQVAGTVKAAGTVLVAGTVLLIETQAEESYI